MKRKFFLTPILLLWLIVACQTTFSEPIPTLTPTPTPLPADYLKLASEAMTEIQSVQFALSRVGAPIIIEPTFGSQFVSAEGEYEAPDRVSTIVKVDINGNILLLEFLWLPEGNYMSNPLTGSYGPQPEGFPLNLVAIFDSHDGISRILAQDVQEPQIVGLETIEGVETRHFQGTADAEALETLTPVSLYGMITVDLWLDVETSLVVRAQITEDNGDQTIFDFFNYNEPVAIPSPNGS